MPDHRMAAEGRSFLAVAQGIADRLCADAIALPGDGCTWRVPGRDGGPQVEMGPFLYRGLAGVAWFLGQAHRCLVEPVYLRTARRALRTALRLEGREEKAVAGFYSGTAGLIATCAEMTALDGDPAWLEEARRLGAKLAAGPKFVGCADLMAGTAGSLLGVLYLYRASGDDGVLETARRLGDELLASCRREADGISWDDMHPKVVRNLLGLSHGAGGIGLALLELHRLAGERRFLVAAVEALRYEQSFTGAAEGLWPDFRHDTVMGYFESQGLDALRRDLRQGVFVHEGEPRAKMAVWCHGAPGIGLVRCRFTEVLGDPTFRAAMERAAGRTLEVLQSDASPNHSLCHGRCGNADILLEMGRRHGVEAWVEAALEVARRGRDEVAAVGGRWLSGYRDAPPAPGLLLGEAGIGLFYLRCADPSVPSILLPTPSTPSTPSPPRDGGRQEVASPPGSAAAPSYIGGVRRGLLCHFGRTAGWLEAFGEDLEHLPIDGSEDLVPTLQARLDRISESADLALGSALTKVREMLLLESRAFELLGGRRDFTRPFLRSLQRDPQEVLAPGAALSLAEGCRLFEGQFDWRPWLGDGAVYPAPQILPPADIDLRAIEARPTAYLLHEMEHRTRLQRLDGLAVLMYRELRRPMTLADFLERMLRHLVSQGMVEAEPDDDHGAVRQRLQGTLLRAHGAAMIDVVEVPQPAGGRAVTLSG